MLDYLYFDTDFVDIDNPKSSDEWIFKKSLESDKWYLNYYKKVKSIKKLYDAGFFIERKFDDSLNKVIILKNHYDYFADYKYKNNCVSTKENIILITCGGFSPLHLGHIEMMNLAKSKMENLDFNVIGGIISPSHDMYVDNKRNGEAKLNANFRISEAEKLIYDTKNDWLTVDYWESLYVPISLNFTTVIQHLKDSLANSNINAKICFVCGSDNLEFTKIFDGFSDDFICCVMRDNSIAPLDSKNILFCNSTENNKDISSKNIRDSNMFNLSSSITTPYYELRSDLKQTLAYLNPSKNSLKVATNKIKSALNSFVIDNPEILLIDVDEQIQKFNLRKSKNLKYISSDIFIEGDFNISISRKFKYLDNNIQSDCLIKRDGSDLSLLNEIPEGEYILVDDDSASGYTKSKIIENLPENVVVSDFIALNDLVRNKNCVAFDIVDARDFIIGSENGGLQVDIGNQIFRVPYLFPYINLYTRANIKQDLQVKFSIEILKANLLFFKHMQDISIDDLKENKNWLLYLGYHSSDSVYSVIQKELAKLTSIDF